MRELNRLSVAEVATLIGHIYEKSPWIVDRTLADATNGGKSGVQFKSVDDLLTRLARTFDSGSHDERLAVLRAHPDLVGKAAKDGQLTESSAKEQANAGLGFNALTPQEITFFTTNNDQYKAKNKKDAIMEAMPRRLRNATDQEFAEACHQVNLIAQVRLLQIVVDDNKL